jgi:DNA-binding transcriptional ArsR family regulator
MTKWLRAAGESSRLRLLSLCAEGTYSVSDLAHALKQSEPRVSRHLRILSEAGLIERLRQGQWVHYRLSSAAEAASFVRGLLGQVDRRDPLLVRDRLQVHAAAGSATHAAGAESRLGRALAELFVAAGAAPAPGAVLLVGVDHPELLESAATASVRCTALAQSRRAAQSARAHAERRGFACRILPTASSETISEADFERAGNGFDCVLLDHPVAAAALPRLLERSRAVLAPRGRLWLFERYDSLESGRGRIVEHPVARLRRLLREAGLECERLTPVEADGEHVLAALARPQVQPRQLAHSQGSER